MKHRDIGCVKMRSSIMVMGVLQFELLMFLAPSVQYSDHCALRGYKKTLSSGTSCAKLLFLSEM